MRRALALAALLMLPAAARADCVYKPFVFHPEKNDGVVVEAVVEAGGRCAHQFGEGPGYTFTSITYQQPEHGKISKVEPYWWFYVPDKDYKGKDAYLFKICASKGALKGCSAVAFVVTVK